MADVFVTDTIPQAGLELLRKELGGFAINPLTRVLTKGELIKALQGRDGVLATLNDSIDGEVIAAIAGRCKVVANFAVGYNNIDVAAATIARIHVTNTPGVLTETTADLAWALMMAAARRLGEAERAVRAGQWEGWRPMNFLGVDVFGQTLGIVGAGRIGTAVARRGIGFGMKLLYTGRRRNREMEDLGGKLVELTDLLVASDFVSLHTPLTQETRGMIGAGELWSMKPTAVLVNTARGAIVQEAALAEALKAGRIFAAGLDVYENEPEIHPGLRELENVVLAPHIGSASRQTRERMAVLAAQNIIAVLSGKKPPTGVNTESLNAVMG